ncbi:MAG: response regulator transcription factor [Polyangiaceae bacterium]|nr:response regulator transcription factor [Polyangiaceae bacterium]
MRRELLFVEDEEASRSLLEDALTARGLSVAAVGDRPSALELARGGRYFDALVTDVVLGDDEDGGLELVAQLREAGFSAPVVVITAFADKRRLKRALELRVSYLLEKPFSADQLISVLNRLWDETSDLTHYVDQALSRARLTPKEREVATMLLKGLSNEEIARVLNNSDKTVRQHLSSVYQKAGVASRAEFFHYVFPT